jgi:large subunit ribosomal protein L15
MQGNTLQPNKGARRARLRVGRGGTTAGRGDKGQRSRSGGTKAGFEGGQTPWYRQLPKYRGFKNRFRTEYQTVNLAQLDKLEAGTVVTPELLIEKGMIRNLNLPIKVLGGSTITKSLTIQLNAATQSAKAAIEGAGGKVEVI